MLKASLKPIFLFLLTVPAFAGLSLVLNPGVNSGVVVDPNLPASQAWRVEFQLSGWTPPSVASTNIWDLNGIGATAELLSSNTLRFLDKRDVTSPSVCDLPLTGYSDVLVRLQRDPVGMQLICELWNFDGSGYTSGTAGIVTINPWPYSGGVFGDQYTSASLGFFREFSTLVPAGSRPPVTAAVGNLTDLKFDGNTLDDSGNGNNLSFPGARFAPTPDQIPISVIKTLGAPAWSNWVSLRAGYPGSLDGTASYSLADASSAVSYQWQELSGPSVLTWSNRTAAQPVVKGLIFGDYRFLLQVTDSAGKMATSTLDVGAVATDDNGVVIQANPAADLLFGPMIAFGKNPWQYQDYIAVHSATVRSSYIKSISPPSWINNLSGTIAFAPFYYTTPRETGLSNAIGAGDTTIVLSNASVLDLSVLPTIILIGPQAPAQEEVRICGVSGNTLTVCFDGRGWRQGLFSEVPTPQAWSSGTAVTQLKTSGTGTTFLTDFCPAGPGEEGQITTAAGTVSVAGGSTTIVGSGTNWTIPFLAGQRIRISGHHSGTSFFFFATVTAADSATSITLSRPYPASADTEGGLAYAIIQPQRLIARGWLRPDGSTGQQLSPVSSCESDTQMYHSAPDGISNTSAAFQTGQNYSWSATSWLSEFGPNYYDEVLAHYAGYFRSGYNLFLSNARGIGDYWTTMPELDQGYVNVTPRHAGITGVTAGALLDGRVNNWTLIRNMAKSGITGPFSGGAILSDCGTDVREDAYGLSWIALAAMFDPVDTGSSTTPNQRSYWKAQLANALTRDQGCIMNNVFSQPFYTGANGAFSLTQGSSTATGTGIPASLCSVAGTGTITVTNGSTSAVGTGFAQNQKIVILAVRNGVHFVFYSLFTANNPNSITLSTPFDGDSGTYSYQIESDQNFLSFATSINDEVNLNTFYACQWVSATTITLDRPWQGTTGTYNASRYLSTYVGFGATPFQNGIKTLAMKYAALGATGATSTGYQAMANTVANWILTEGFDPLTLGLYYARGFYNCEPPGIYKIGCDYGPDPDSKAAARTLSGEAQNALSLAYEASPTPTDLLFGDQFYGAQWGKPGYGTPPFSDGIYLSFLDMDSTFAYKWIGFLFGIGMSHQWPAVRLGGVQPPVPVTPSIGLDLAAVSGAASALIKVTEPSGAVAYYTCTASPCQVQVDARQGAPWHQVMYLDSQGHTLRQARPEILEVN